MATKYAVVSGSWSDTATWSDTDGGAGGATVPVDDDTVVISANVSVLMNVDQSSAVTFPNGMAGLTIRSHATTPGMLYFKNGTNGYLKIKTGTTIQGTNAAAKGRILANSDGNWDTTTELQVSNTAVIHLVGTGSITATYLLIRLFCSQPTTKFIHTYGTKLTVTVDIATNTFSTGATPHGFSTGNGVMFKSSGTLPAPLEANIPYYFVSVSSTTFRIKYCTNGYDVDITSSGSGTVEVYGGHTNTGTATLNVFEDVTTEPDHWRTTAGRNFVVLANVGSTATQLSEITNITGSTLTLSANVASARGPNAPIMLLSRNVSIWASPPAQGTTSVLNPDSCIFQCEVRQLTSASLLGYCVYRSTNCSFSGAYGGFYFFITEYGQGNIYSGVFTRNYYHLSALYTAPVGIFSGTAYGSYVFGSSISITIADTAEVGGTEYFVTNGYSVRIEGGFFVGGTYFIANTNWCVFLGGRVNYYYGIYNSYQVEVLGGDFSGTSALISSSSVVYCPSLIGTSSVATKSTVEFYGAILSKFRDLGTTSKFLFRNCAISYLYEPQTGTLNTVVGYGSSIDFTPPSSYMSITDNFNLWYTFYDYGGNAGYLKAWNSGGTLATEAYVEGTHGIPPVTLAVVHRNTFTNGKLNGIDIPICGLKDVLTVVKVYMKKSVNSMTTTPYVKICDPNYGFGQTGEQLDIATMSDDTDWQTLTVSYRPSYDKQLKLRVAGANSSGTLFWNWEQVNVSETKLIDSTVYDSVIY